MKKKPTITELEKLLNSEEDQAITILPNGQIKRSKKSKKGNPLVTFKENLGGEYGFVF